MQLYYPSPRKRFSNFTNHNSMLTMLPLCWMKNTCKTKCLLTTFTHSNSLMDVILYKYKQVFIQYVEPKMQITNMLYQPLLRITPTL